MVYISTQAPFPALEDSLSCANTYRSYVHTLHSFTLIEQGWSVLSLRNVAPTCFWSVCVLVKEKEENKVHVSATVSSFTSLCYFKNDQNDI